MINKRLVALCPLSALLLYGSYQIFIRIPEFGENVNRALSRPFGKLLESKSSPKRIVLPVPILTYHYVEDVTDERDTLRQSMATRPYFLEEQLRFLENNDYVSITLSDLKRALEGRATLPQKSVVLTFDDGYRDFYTDAFPLLKKYKTKSINYIIVNHIGRSGNLTEATIREMLSSGLVEIGCHTLDHVYLPKEKLEEARRQIVDCKSQLESRFGVRVNHFAYPGGYSNGVVVDLVRQAGFETAVGTVPGVVQTLDQAYSLKRLRVGNLDQAAFGKHLLGPKAE